MGSMLARALLRSGAVAPAGLWVANRSPEKPRELRREWPAVHVASNDEVAAGADTIFVCVHPPDMQPVIDALAPRLRAGQLLVVIANALPLVGLAQRVPCAVAKVIPTVTQEVGRGSALAMFPPDIDPALRERLQALLSHIGDVVVIPEALGRACANLTSAGPALIARVLQEMAEAARAADPALDAETAWKLAASAAAGTGELLAQMPPEELIARVATPGGMTEAGLDVLHRTAPAMWREVFDRMRARESETRKKMGPPEKA